MRYVAVDWSGSLAGGGSEIWLAAVEDGELVDLRGRLTRSGVVELVSTWLGNGIDMVIGLDFAFSMPAWYVEMRHCSSAPEFWGVVEKQGESWLATCPPPFWGKPGKRRDSAGKAAHRRTEMVVGGSPKSVFQVGGAGAVGTGSIRGMPLLARLRKAGFAVWPFDPPSSATIVEIYPRLLTGIGPKRQQAWCRAYLDAIDWPRDLSLRSQATTTEDSFDSAVSAFRMWEARSELARLPAPTDRIELLEGRIWEPAQAVATVQVAAWERDNRAGSGRTPAPVPPVPHRSNGEVLCRCGCGAGVRQRYLPGHDAKHKSRLVREARAGDPSAIAELTRLGWSKFLKR